MHNFVLEEIFLCVWIKKLCLKVVYRIHVHIPLMRLSSHFNSLVFPKIEIDIWMNKLRVKMKKNLLKIIAIIKIIHSLIFLFFLEFWVFKILITSEFSEFNIWKNFFLKLSIFYLFLFIIRTIAQDLWK